MPTRNRAQFQTTRSAPYEKSFLCSGGSMVARCLLMPHPGNPKTSNCMIRDQLLVYARRRLFQNDGLFSFLPLFKKETTALNIHNRFYRFLRLQRIDLIIQSFDEETLKGSLGSSICAMRQKTIIRELPIKSSIGSLNLQMVSGILRDWRSNPRKYTYLS